MKNYIIIAYIFVCLCLTVNLSDLNAQEKTHKYKDREKAETNTSAFNPSYFKIQEEKHIILYFNIVEGKLELSDKDAILINGKRAYTSTSGGQFLIITKDHEGKILSKYYIQDPTSIRLIDGDEQALQPIKNYENLQIAVPFHEKMKTIELGTEEDKISFDLFEKVKKQ